MNAAHLQAFKTSYIACALWSSQREDGDRLDEHYTVADFSSELTARIDRDCESFYVKHLMYFNTTERASQAGHDFWLTRNGHGAGFWESGRGWTETEGHVLTKASETYGTIDVYVGDDGTLYA